MIFGNNWSFVQNPKAASSAVTDALLPFCRPVPPSLLPDGKFSKHDIPRPGTYPRKEFRLGIVRNPYDRLVSAWAYLVHRQPETWGNVSFREFVLDRQWMIGRAPRLIDFCRTPQTAWLADCNYVLRFERLNTDFAEWSMRAIGRRVNLGHTNPSPRSGGFAGYYMITNGGGLDHEMLDVVRSRFEFDIKLWGYDFG